MFICTPWWLTNEFRFRYLLFQGFCGATISHSSKYIMQENTKYTVFFFYLYLLDPELQKILKLMDRLVHFQRDKSVLHLIILKSLLQISKSAKMYLSHWYYNGIPGFAMVFRWFHNSFKIFQTWYDNRKLQCNKTSLSRSIRHANYYFDIVLLMYIYVLLMYI